MNQPWYQKLFGRAQNAGREINETKAGSGDAEAQFSLGLMYANSEGGAQDYAQAAQWYRKAADQSHALAQFNLGVMYAQGQGVGKDEATAVMWIRKAAEQGDAGAQFNLGMRQHRASIGALPVDALESRIEAYKWLHLAATQGYKDSETVCGRLTISMTREDVANGNHRAADFTAGKLKPIQA